MAKTLLVTGGTGRQGGAVIQALLEADLDVNIIAVHRNPQYDSAQALARRSPKIRLLSGDLNDAAGIFASAARAFPNHPIWGVYSMQAAGADEVRQGKALVDAALANNVRHFVYSSVDRGGEAKSWSSATRVPHFRRKQEIELHLREAAGTRMGWTILRPVAFMENLTTGFGARVLLTALHKSAKVKKLQWVATKDVGFFAAEAFQHPDRWNHRAMSIAGDELSSDEIVDIFKASGAPSPYTVSLLGSALKLSKDTRVLIEWSANEGHAADVAEARKLNPKLCTFESFLRTRQA